MTLHFLDHLRKFYPKDLTSGQYFEIMVWDSLCHQQLKKAAPEEGQQFLCQILLSLHKFCAW